MIVSPRNAPLLWSLHPSFPARFPWLSLGHFPTPVGKLPLPGDAEVWIKRDDLSGTLYGGNKVRKLEFLLAAAQRVGAQRVVTVGAIGSHHVLATAIYASQLGMKTRAVVFPQPPSPHVTAQLGAHALLGTELVWVASPLLVPLALHRARKGGYYIPAGGSSALGSLGYVDGALELLAQIATGELPSPDVIYVALGSCGTAAGLRCGLGRLNAELRCVRVVDRIVSSRRIVNRLVRELAALLAPAEKFFAGGDRLTLSVDHRYFGGAYARPTPASAQAVARAGEQQISLETTYTGKAFAALLADLESGALAKKRVLFWNSYNSATLPVGDLDRADFPAGLRRYMATKLGVAEAPQRR